MRPHIAVLFAVFSGVILADAPAFDPRRSEIVAAKGLETQAEELKRHLDLIYGTDLPIRDAAKRVPPGKFVWHVGASRRSGETFEKEEGRWETAADGVWFDGAGKYGVETAIYDFLLSEMGVRWPWGDEIAVHGTPPASFGEKRGGRRFDLRRREIRTSNPTYRRWRNRLRMGAHDAPVLGHSFLSYWDRYALSDPDIFAMRADGKRLPPGAPANADNAAVYIGTKLNRRMSMCVSSDKLVGFVIDDWLRHGTNEYINVCENDAEGKNACRCEKCRALDVPPPPEMYPWWEDCYADRYVNFANRVLAAARKVRPDAKVCFYAYNATERAPRRERLSDGLVPGIVPTCFDYATVTNYICSWKRAGLGRFVYRPNRHLYYYSPYLPLGAEEHFFSLFKFACEQGAIGFDYDQANDQDKDSVLEWFGDYTLLRGMQDPSKDFASLEREYMEAFGAAADDVRDYFRYWRREIWEKRIRKDILKLSLEGKWWFFNRGLYWHIGDYYRADDFDRAGAYLERALARPGLADADRARVERVKLANDHARLMHVAIVRKCRANSIALRDFRVKHGIKLLPWYEDYYGDICGIKTVEEIGDAVELTGWQLKLKTDPAGEEDWKPVTLDRHWRDDYNGVGWYRCRFNLDDPEAPAKLIFLAVDGIPTIRLNGMVVQDGHPIADPAVAWKTRFEVPVAGMFRKGMNEIQIRIDKKVPGRRGIIRPVCLDRIERPPSCKPDGSTACYHPVQGGFEIKGGRAEFSRPLYGSHAADDCHGPHKNVVWTGDRPKVMLGRYPADRKPKTPGDGVLEFGRGLADVTYRYVEGRAEYDFAGVGSVTLVRPADSDGLLAEVKGSVPRDATGAWTLLASESCEGAEYLHFGRPDEKPTGSVASAFEAAKARLSALSRTVRVETPDPLLDALVSAMNVAADALFEEGMVMHGAVAWHMVYAGWRGAYVPVTLARDEDFRRNAKAYFDRQGPDGRLPCTPWKDRPYNMCEVFVDSVLRYWERSADTAFFRACAYGGIKRHLGWLESTMEVPGAALYENWLNAWNTDNKWCNGGAGTVATAYAYRAYEAMSRVAAALGETDDAAQFAARARTIRADAERLLYSAESGTWGEYRERFGSGRLMGCPDLSSVYTPIDMGLSSPDRTRSSLAWIERNVPSAFCGDGAALLHSSNKLPGFYSTCGLYPQEAVNLAHAYYLAGEPEIAWRHLRDALGVCVRGETAGPGIVALQATADLRNAGHADFGDTIGVVLRAVVEGLFGIRMNAPEKRATIAPGFPAAWDSARIETPYLSYAWTRSGGVKVTANPLGLEIRVAAPSPVLVGSALPRPHGRWGEPKGAGTDYGLPKGVSPSHVDLGGAYNRNWRLLHTEAFGPRIGIFPHDTWKIPRTTLANGRCWWEQLDSEDDQTCARGGHNVPERLDWPADRTVRTPSGLSFRLGEYGAKNGVFVSLFTNLPDRVSVPLSGRASKTALLTVLSTNPNQDWMTAAKVVVRYADGGAAELALTPPDNCDDWLNYLQRRPYHLTGEHVMFGVREHANVLALDLDPARELKALEFQCVGTETIAGLLSLTLYGRSADDDWGAVNEASRREALSVLRPGKPGQAPFWNGRSRAFIHPPAFEFETLVFAVRYRFTVTELSDGRRHVFEAKVPWAPLTPVWDALRPGYVLAVAEGVREDGTTVGVAGARHFYRAARFAGPYPSGNRAYAEAAQRCFAAICHLPYVQGWLAQDTPPEGYDLYCYPSKILSSMIEALVRYSAGADGDDAAKALVLARKMADWLIAQSQPSGSLLEFVPPTYWGDRRKTAVEYAGQNMLIYPVFVGRAYLSLYGRTGEAKYRDAALRIAATMRRLQNERGTWWLKVREKDGTPVRQNLLVPGVEFLDFFSAIARLSGDNSYEAVAERAQRFVEEGTFRTWNWDGQFEDIDPTPPYHNLTATRAFGYSGWLFKAGRTDEARETLAWCEDQFVVWSDPVHHRDWTNWKLPTALEQYDYYTPIDASMANAIRAFAVGWESTGDVLYLEKAKALADCLLRHQRPDGTIPTYFDGNRGSDWVNCMIASATALHELGAILSKEEKGKGKWK